MNKEDIIRMAREAGLHSAVLLHIYEGKEAALTDSEQDELRRLERFAAFVAAAENEACAKVCETYEVASIKNDAHNIAKIFNHCAAAIRARSNP